MTLKNGNVIREITEIFDRMHAKLDQRFQKLLRQVNSHSNSLIHARYRNNESLVFSPANEKQLEQAINNFGRLSTSNSVVPWVTNLKSTTHDKYSISASHRLPMRRATSQATSNTDDDNNSNKHDYRTIGKHGRQRGQFSNPQDVLFMAGPTTTLLVSDTLNQNVQHFSLETSAYIGTLLPTPNSKQIPLRRPIGLSIIDSSKSACFVADYDQHLISSWTIDETGNGKLVKKFGQQSLIGPKGLCVSNQSQRIVVADNKANCLCLYEANGTFLFRFGKRGSEQHELAGPHYVRFAEPDNDRTIIVTDFSNNCVKIFDIERQGQIVSSFGSCGTKGGSFQAPTGLAIDYERGCIFVSDWGNNRIQIFDRQGSFIRILELSTPDLLFGPQGLDYEPITRTLAIANSGRHCVNLFHIV